MAASTRALPKTGKSLAPWVAPGIEVTQRLPVTTVGKRSDPGNAACGGDPGVSAVAATTDVFDAGCGIGDARGAVADRIACIEAASASGAITHQIQQVLAVRAQLCATRAITNNRNEDGRALKDQADEICEPMRLFQPRRSSFSSAPFVQVGRASPQNYL
jgi:hypothetical protein